MSKKNPGFIRSTISFMKSHWRILILVVGLPTLASNLVAVLGGGQETVTAYISMASLFVNVALIWTVVRLHDNKPVSFVRAYYEGTASVLRFLLVAVILTFQTIPAAIGLGIYYFGTRNPSASMGIGEVLLLAAVALLFAAPTIFWLSRSIFSLYLVVAEGLRPTAALSASKKIVKGHFWQVVRRLLLLLIVLLATVFVPSAAVVLIGGGAANKWVMAIIQSVLVSVMLPFMNVYLYKFYRYLSAERV